MMRLVLSIAAVLVLVAGADGASASSPNAFDDDYDAALAVAGDTQWLIVGGVDKKRSGDTYGIEAFERVGTGAWTALPPLPGRFFNSSYGLHAVVQGTTDPYPCFLYPLDAGPRLECLRAGRWVSAIGRQFDGANIEDLTAPTPDSMALVYLRVHERQDRVLTYVARSDAGGPWQQVGDPFEGVIVAQFAESDVPAPLRVGIELMKRERGTRYVAEATDAGWVVVTPRDRDGIGPFVGGPLSVAGTTYFPATNASVDLFQFQVLSLAPGAATWTLAGGGPLNAANVAGQGSLAIVDGAPWAIWQEDRQRRRTFRSAVRIAPLETTPVTPVTLWSGKRIGPGPLAFADGATANYAMYARNSRQGLRVVVEALAP